jgi:signal transduction histidine kinase
VRYASVDRSLSATRDLQTLLSQAVQQLRVVTGCYASAWALREDGVPYLAAADFDGAMPPAPIASDFSQLAALREATDLTDRRIGDELAELARRHGCHAAAAVRGAPADALAVLLLHASNGSLERPPPRGGALPKRWLGELDQACAELGAPLAAALALGRLRQLDREVRHLDRLAALGSLSAELAHELRNPLVAVNTFLQLMPERRHDPAFLDDFCAVAREELARMKRLLDTTIELAQPNPVSPSAGPASAAHAVAAVGRLLFHYAARRGVQLRAEVPGELPQLAISPDGLHQVLLNLIQNAVDATPEGARVEVRAHALATGQVEIAVRDEGPGIHESLADRVFEPFFTTREGGVGGLGLSISRRIVDEAGGSLSFESKVGVGTRMRVQLPCSRPHGES